MVDVLARLVGVGVGGVGVGVGVRVRVGVGVGVGVSGRGVGAREDGPHLRERIALRLEPHVDDEVVELLEGHGHCRGVAGLLAKALGVGTCLGVG